MQGDAWHDVYEETGNFIETVENQAIAPHDDCNRIVAKGEREG